MGWVMEISVIFEFDILDIGLVVMDVGFVVCFFGV